jgi:hypothetical protein
MMQSPVMSLTEAVANVVVGYGVAVVVQIGVFPLFGFWPTIRQNLTLGAVFTGVSLVRSYVLRRLFEHLRLRRERQSAAGP